MLLKFGVVQHHLAMGRDVTVPMTFKVTESEVIARIVSVSSCLVGITGGLSNLASLLYFMTRAEKSLSRQIFIMLNSFDLLVCLSVVPSVVLYFCKATLCGFSQLPFRISYAFFNLGIECTALSTCLLGVLRFIAIRFPYYQVKKKVLASVTITFILLEALREVLRIYFYFFDRSKQVFYLKFHNAAMISVLTLAVVINSISSILLTCHLLCSSKRPGSGIRNNTYNQKYTSRSSRRGTVTIIILSTSFLFCNSLYGINLFIIIFTRPGQQTTKPSTTMKLLGMILLWLFIPMNSTLNSLVYFLRRKEMRNFVKDLPWSLFKREAIRQGSSTI